MKTTLLTKAVGALLLSVTALVAHAVPIAFFDNPTYVETTTPPSGSADALQAALVSLNNTVTPFTEITAAGFANALQGEQILVIPEQARSALAPDLTPEAIAVIRDFVSNGGGLIISADYQDFLNTVFGYGLSVDISNAASVLTPAAIGTAFEGGPATIPANDATIGFTLDLLPSAAKSIYTDPAGLLSTVTLFQFGDGQIVQLGWDFTDAVPLGNVDGGWLCVLNSSVAQVNGSTTNPNPSGNCNSNTNGGGGSVPEPSSVALMLAALGACVTTRRRRP